MNIKIKIYSPDGTGTISTTSNKKLSEIIGISHEAIDLPCGGSGVCGKCRIFASGNISKPSETEIKLLGDELNDGIRLACLCYALGDCEITLTTTKDNNFNKAVINGITAPLGKKPLYKNYGLAIDIGTTTLAVKLLKDGNVIAGKAIKNPQTAFGGDVISRIAFAINGKSNELATLVKNGLNSIISDITKSANISKKEIDAAVITGNTAMLYLLTKRNPTSLSSAPFNADWLAGQWVSAASLGFNFAEHSIIYFPRCISAFVGADITTAILASGITNSDETSLLVDIGTNGEMALWHNGSLTCCSTAAGPAFEGAGIVCGIHGVDGAIDTVYTSENKPKYTVIGNNEPCGICGSGVIDAVATMLDLAVLDEGGCIIDDYPCDYINSANGSAFFKLKDEIGIYAKDIRAVQLAKSAICSGIETLLTRFSVKASKLYIAGGFGSYLNIENAVKIGLIPSNLNENALSIGNAALFGAVMLLSDSDLIEKSEALAKNATTIDLSTNPVFLEKYIDNMIFNQAKI